MTGSDPYPPDPISPVHAIPLIGRQAEIETIQEHLRHVREAGRGSKLAICAESGMGKSRLAHEAALHAREQGVWVAFVPCRGSQHRPGHPLTDLVCALLGVDATLPANQLYAHIEHMLASLGLQGLASVFVGLFPSSTAPTLLVGGRQSQEDDALYTLHKQTGLADALARVLQALGERHGATLLILDDLDEANESLSELAFDLLEGLASRSVLSLATFASGASPELESAFGEAILNLSNLSQEQTLALGAARLHAGGVMPDLADVLWNQTEGHPLYAVMLSDYLLEGGYIARQEPDGYAALNGDPPIANSVKELVENRLMLLPENRRKAMRHASLLGGGFKKEVLGTLLEQIREEDLHNVLTALVEAGWLERSGQDDPAIYRFTNALTRDILREDIPPRYRSSLHIRAGDHYAKRSRGHTPSVEQAIYHYLQAGDTGRALAVLDLALERARQNADREQAITLYRRGLGISSSDITLVKRQAELAEALGDIYATVEDYNEAATVYGELGPTISPLTLLGKLGLVLLAANTTRAISVFSQVIPAVPPDYPNDLRWRLEAGYVWALTLTGRQYDAMRRSRDALGILSSMTGFGFARTLMRGSLGMALFYQGAQEEAYPHLESARAGWGARGDQDGVVFINQVLIATPMSEITRDWVRLLLRPLLQHEFG